MSKKFEILMKRALWVLVIVFIVRCLFSSEEIIKAFSIYHLFGYAGESIGVTVIIMAAYNKWLWKLDHTIKVPVLKRKYTGTIKSSFNGKCYKAELEIHQTLLSISVILKTQESSSRSVMSSIDDILGEQQLTYTYLNTPMACVRNRSAIHFGTAMINIDNPMKLTGTYFTDRKSTGDVDFIPEYDNQ